MLKSYLLFCLYLDFVFCVDLPLWSTHHPGIYYGNREELVITDVVSDKNFGHNRNVTMWKTISLGNKCYSVGLMHDGIIVVTSILGEDKKNFVVQENMLELHMNFTNIELFEYWNEMEREFEAIVVVSSSGITPELLWYKITENTLNKFWTWHLHKNVSHLRYFNFENKHMLLLISRVDMSSPSLDLYEFGLNKDNQTFWLSQAISLPDVANSSAINTFGVDLYLSIPQRHLNEVLVYKFTQNRFELHHNIHSEGVTQVASFKIGFKSFLAINGYSGGIYQFTKTDIIREKIDTLNLEYIDYWLPVPVKTYRDEVLLIVEHSLPHGTHYSHFLETVVYDFDKQTFLIHDEIACSFFEEALNGLSCMTEEEEQPGLPGASVWSLGKLVGIIVPHRNTSVLFMVHTAMKQLKSPFELEIEQLLETKTALQQMIAEQQATIKDIEKKLENSLKPKQENHITAPWNLTTLSAPMVVKTSETSQLQIENLRKEDEIDIEELLREAKEIFGEIEDIKVQLSQAYFINASEHHFDELTVNGEVEVIGESYFKDVSLERLNDESVNEVFNDLVRKTNFSEIRGHKTFTDLRTDNVTFDIVNGIKQNDIVFNKSEPIVIKGNLVFEKPLVINEDLTSKSGKLNDQIIESEFVQMDHEFDDHSRVKRFDIDAPLRLETLEIDFLALPGNITIENINRRNFDQLMTEFCLVNVDNYIRGTTTVEGDVKVVGDVNTELLHNLLFPDEYVLQNSQFSTINGSKTFDSTVIVNELLVSETINGVNPDDVVSMRKNQCLSGTFTFNDLEVTENFYVGEIVGPYLEHFLENPALNETNHVKAKVNFKSLEVDGEVIVSNKFNGDNLEALLGDVIYEDEEHAMIQSIKEMPEGFTVNGGFTSVSNYINDIPLDLFITKDTLQTIEIETLNAAVTITNLNLGGLFGGMNITQFNEETVKTTGHQFISSTLIFDNENDPFVDLSATDFVITKTLNNVSVSDYYFTSTDSRLIKTDPLKFENIETDEIFIEGGISGTLTDFSLEDFDARRLSLTRDQIITADYKFKQLRTQNLKAVSLNGESFEKVFDPQHFADIISEMFFDGKLTIKNLHINGSMFVETVNDQDMSYMKNCLWTNKENNFKTAVFEGDIIMKDLNLKNFNNMDFKLFIDNLIFNTEKDIVIEDFKVFTNGFHVVKMINSERLNDVHVDDILTKRGVQELPGPLQIFGDVYINSDAEIYETLNDIPMEYLAKTYEFDGDTFVVNEDIVFHRLQYVDKLIVEGAVNGKDLQEFLDNIVYKSENTTLDGTVIFENEVEINKNLIVKGTLNNVDLSDFVDEMVFITKPEVIDGMIIFTRPVIIEEDLIVDSNLETKYLMGIKLQNWIEGAVYINHGLIPGTLTFESVKIQGDVTLDFINDINLSNLIPLQEKQEINQTMFFGEIIPFYDIPVGNLVNGYKLPEEYRNSILMNSNSTKDIRSNIIFKGNVLIRDNLDIIGLINGHDLSRIVTTNTDQNLTAMYNFDGKVIMNSNLFVIGKLNNINFPEWQAKSVKTYSIYPQNIYDHWVVDGDITFKDNVLGGGLINGLDIREVAAKYEEKRLQKFSTRNSLMRGYVSACKDVNVLHSKAETQVYFFKYFDYFQSLEFDQTITNVHHFKFFNDNYLLITENSICMSSLFIFTDAGFEIISQFETGAVDQIISVHDGDLLFFAIKNSENHMCAITGVNVWKFEITRTLTMLYKLEDHELLQDSLVPGTFYGLTRNIVYEYKLITVSETDIKGYRKWVVNSENLVFVPRGLGTGLAVSDGYKLFRLIKEDSTIEDDYSYETQAYLIGKVVEEVNYFLPGRKSGQLSVLNVGMGNRKRTMAAQAFSENTSVRGKFDYIKIYENVLKGKLFLEIPAYKPSSLTSLEFGNNGETLLMFLEDQKVLQVYEYKGIEGFKFRTSAEFPGTKLITMNLPTMMDSSGMMVVGIINGNEFNMIRAVMSGNQIKLEKSVCEL